MLKLKLSHIYFQSTEILFPSFCLSSIVCADAKEVLESDATTQQLNKIAEDCRSRYGGSYFGEYMHASLFDVGSTDAHHKLPRKLDISIDKGLLNFN